MIDREQAADIYQLMTVAAWADGRIDPAETHVADDLIAQIPALQPLAGQLAAEAKARIDQLGIEGALREIAGRLRSPEHRELAFLFCARLIEADRKIAQAEFGVLLKLRALFELDDDRVARLLALAQAT